MNASNKYEEGKNDTDDMETIGCSQDGKLIIYAAIYGLADVTNTVRNKINQKNQSLSIQAINSIFGDPWSGIKKTLIIVWGFEGTKYIQTNIVIEGATLDIDKSRFNSKFVASNESGKLNVLSAVYGLKEHSGLVQSKVKNSNLSIVANNGVFGDSWQGIKKSMVLVYRMGLANPKDMLGNIQVKVVQEGQRLSL